MKRPTTINFSPPVLAIGDRAYCVCGPSIYGKEEGEEVEILNIKHERDNSLYLVIYDKKPCWLGWHLFWSLTELSDIESKHELSRPHTTH